MGMIQRLARLVLGFVVLSGGGLATACSPPPMSCADGIGTNIMPAANSTQIAPPVAYTYEVVNSYPHDRTAFTEGLEIVDGQLYESLGLNGQSELRRVDLTTGKVEQRITLPAEFFGEGITIFNGRIYQLTWQSHVGFVYDLKTFAKEREWSYPSEGWGFTHDRTHLIMSDGTATVRCLNPDNLKEVGSIEVRDNNGPVTQINELEYVNGAILANIWQTDRVIRIAPQSGVVTGSIDLSGLLTPEERQMGVDVLNGIAYDAQNKRLFVTGKFWPRLFEIRLIEKTS